MDSFRKRVADITAFTQLKATFEGCKATGAAIGSPKSAGMLNSCLKMAIDSVKKLQKGPEKDKEIERKKEESTANTTGTTKKEDKDNEGSKDDIKEVKSVIINTRLHCEAYESLCILQSNQHLWAMVETPFQQKIQELEQTFCHLHFRYFDSLEEMKTSRFFYTDI